MNTAEELHPETFHELLDKALENAGFSTLKHMTHIRNLENILKYGLHSHGNSFQTEDISNQTVNDRRSRRDPFFHRSLHDYVPFYFNPRNAMLYKTQREYGQDIIILGYSPELLLQNEILVTNGNAACDDTLYSHNFNYLFKIDWKTVFSSSWCYDGLCDHKRKQKMMAEALIPAPQGLGKHYLRTIYCQTEYVKRIIEKHFSLGHIRVVCKPSLFFKG
ncbi:DUF4433 domain-containing protein [Thalassotalea ponticola]|uniref:DUF4433 domain-containing protein n=1 Tax=Thalassotalea ponticola TaxID=1523392 RepID=UPI0025B2E862|nr:DUF4433 domain-containing protein [Thalassotalea ponticola]MDN3651370.1 DUF4433 domain-containing protein [Thalassotalea ponticola]